MPKVPIAELNHPRPCIALSSAYSATETLLSTVTIARHTQLVWSLYFRCILCSDCGPTAAYVLCLKLSNISSSRILTIHFTGVTARGGGGRYVQWLELGPQQSSSILFTLSSERELPQSRACWWIGNEEFQTIRAEPNGTPYRPVVLSVVLVQFSFTEFVSRELLPSISPKCRYKLNNRPYSTACFPLPAMRIAHI